jgi:hypothetical protein
MLYIYLYIVVDDHLLDKEVTLFTKKNNALKDFH